MEQADGLVASAMKRLAEPALCVQRAGPRKMLLGPDHAGTGERHGTGQCKDSTGHTGAGGYGVADVRENVSCKGGVGAESGGAADLPEDISCRRSLGQGDRGTARCRKRALNLENVHTAAVEGEGSGQLRGRIKTIDAGRERDRAGTGA